MGISFNAAALLNGNGINVSAVVSELQSAESGQMTAWQGDVTNLQTQATALNSINSDLSNLASAVQGFTGSDGALTAVTANSSESAIVNATAQTGATAGNYTVVVSSLASTGTLYTDSVASAKSVILPSGQSTGELQVQIGGSGGTTANIAITGSNDTLTTLAQSINTQSASNEWGITASVVTDADGAHLAIYSQSTGSAGALSIPTGGNTTSLTFEPPVGGTNAEITINGIPYASTTNTVTGAIPDVTLDLVSADPATPVTVTVGPDTTSITNSINNFVTEYNTVIGDLNTQFTVNASTSQEGPLGSDTDLRVLQSSLAADITYATTDATSVSSGFTNLAALGITMNNDGTLSVDSSTLSDALSSNPAAVQNFFTNSNVTGFADNMNADLTNLTDPATGILTEDLASNQSQQNDLNTEITNFQTQLAAQQTALTTEFDQVNANLEEYPFTLAEVNAALGALSTLEGGTGTSTSTGVTAPSADTTPTSGTSAASGSSSTGSSS
ncbi:MAG: flagellar filament capping protein FliD [Terriglobales bacterium]